MGINFDRDMQIAGYRPAVFKDALSGFMRTRSVGNMIDLKSVFPLRRDGAIVFEECLDRGLIAPTDGDFEIIEAGKVIARAKAVRRTPLAQAKAQLEDFLRRVDKLNHDPNAVRYVDQVWLFGSLMRGEETVGDIDLALQTTRRPEYMQDYEAMTRHLNNVLSRHDDVPTTRNPFWSGETWLTERSLYGRRRHPLLAGIHDGLDQLVGLSVPCQLIYDRGRGGRISDPVLSRHPQSAGRRDDVEPPADMPDLSPRDLRPMDARWVAGFSKWGGVSPYDIFRGWTDDAHKIFPHYPEGLRVFGDDHEPRGDRWTPKRLKGDVLDGREAIALVNATPYSGSSIVLRRHLTKTPTSWTLHAWFEDLELYRSRKRVDLSTLPDIAGAAALIIAVDAERMLRRLAEESPNTPLQVKLARRDLGDDVSTGLFETVRNYLQSRAVRIEPDGWKGPPASIVCQ